jgi:DNA segregation ATPase FtsK/SpoIIIE, S-DNA-T family
MDSLYFTRDERDFFDRVLRDGLRYSKGPYWWVVRLAIARSLREEQDPDDRYRSPGSNGSELHLEQITGLRSSKLPDYNDALKLILAVRHEQDLWADDRAYVDLVQKHARRGLSLMQSEWAPSRSFNDYIFDALYSGLDTGEDSPSEPTGVINTTALLQGLKQLGVSAASAGEPQEGPRLTRFPLTLAGVEDYDRLRRGLDDLSFAVGLGQAGLALSRGQAERRVLLDIPRPSGAWRDVPWSRVAGALAGRPEALPVCPGVDILDQPVIFDLAEAPHLFVGGATGSGKSVCVNALLLSLLAATRPPELVLIDPKGVDFADFESAPNLGDGVITDMGAAVDRLRSLVAEMDVRQTALRDAGVRNIAQAQAAGAQMERVVVVVDELADFLMERSGAEEPLIRLAQKARAVGIHLLLATQRPEAATFPGLLRSNIPSRIALTVQKAADSRIILDEAGAETLLMKGDMLIKLAGRDVQRAHGARVETADIKAAIARVRR